MKALNKMPLKATCALLGAMTLSSSIMSAEMEMETRTANTTTLYKSTYHTSERSPIVAHVFKGSSYYSPEDIDYITLGNKRFNEKLIKSDICSWLDSYISKNSSHAPIILSYFASLGKDDKYLTPDAIKKKNQDLKVQETA